MPLLAPRLGHRRLLNRLDQRGNGNGTLHWTYSAPSWGGYRQGQSVHVGGLSIFSLWLFVLALKKTRPPNLATSAGDSACGKDTCWANFHWPTEGAVQSDSINLANHGYFRSLSFALRCAVLCALYKYFKKNTRFCPCSDKFIIDTKMIFWLKSGSSSQF